MGDKLRNIASHDFGSADCQNVHRACVTRGLSECSFDVLETSIWQIWGTRVLFYTHTSQGRYHRGRRTRTCYTSPWRPLEFSAVISFGNEWLNAAPRLAASEAGNHPWFKGVAANWQPPGTIVPSLTESSPPRVLGNGVNWSGSDHCGGVLQWQNAQVQAGKWMNDMW
jgi:hypothetical protein